MRKTLKIKVLVVIMVVMMGLTMIPMTFAESAFVNVVTESEAEIVISANADKTEYAPGDKVRITLSLDKVPENGVSSFSARIAFDQSKMTLNVEESTIGSVGAAFDWDEYTFEDANINTNLITLGGVPSNPRKAPKEAGTLCTIVFDINEDASGDLGLFVVSPEDNGLDVTGYDDQNTTQNKTNYLKTNLNDITVPVPATGIHYEGITNLEMDKSVTPSKDISQYVVVEPSNTTDTISYSSEDPSVATVDNAGVVTAVGNGETKIVVECGNFSAKLPVKVTTSIKSVAFKNAKYPVDFGGEALALIDEVVYNPEDADTSVEKTWTSSNESIATVDAQGNVTAVAKGTATITVTANGKSATTTVVVTVPLTDITLSESAITLYKGDSKEINVAAAPEGAEWVSLESAPSEGSEAISTEETASGVKVTGLKEGTAKVLVTANKGQNNELVKELTVTVKENKVTAVSIVAEEVEEFVKGSTMQVSANYETTEPESVHPCTDDTTVTWTSSDESVATVDENGVVTAVAEGTATITATIAGVTEEMEITVVEHHIEGIEVSEETMDALNAIESICVGDKIEIPFTIIPENCTDTVEEIIEFVKSEYDEDAIDVKVTYDGKTKTGKVIITAKKAGEANISICLKPEGDDDDGAYLNGKIIINEVPVEEPAEEENGETDSPETGDMPVVMFAIMMGASAAGIVTSKKILEK